MNDAIVTTIVALFGSGTVAAIVQAVISHRKGVRDSDVSRDQTTFEQMQVILSEHKDAIRELREAREEDTRRLDDLAEENRRYRWTMIGVKDRLKMMPPLTAADILEYIHERIPTLGKDRH